MSTFANTTLLVGLPGCIALHIPAAEELFTCMDVAVQVTAEQRQSCICLTEMKTVIIEVWTFRTENVQLHTDASSRRETDFPRDRAERQLPENTSLRCLIKLLSFLIIFFFILIWINWFGLWQSLSLDLLCLHSAAVPYGINTLQSQR